MTKQISINCARAPLSKNSFEPVVAFSSIFFHTVIANGMPFTKLGLDEHDNPRVT
jgi:hypothetical protein